MYKKYRRVATVADGIDTALSVTNVGFPASCFELLSTIIASPVAIGFQAVAIVCGLLRAGGKLVCRKLQAKARKHDFIRGLAESNLNTIADRISVALNDDKITEEEFRLILSEIDKYNQMKAEIRGHQKHSVGLSEDKKKSPPCCLCLIGECATAGTGAGRPDGPIELENSPEWGLGDSAACGFFRLEYPLCRIFWRRRTGAWRPDGPI